MWVLKLQELKNLSDEELVILSKQDDHEAMIVLFNRYRNMMSFYSRSFHVQGSDFDDLMQEAFIAFFKAIKNFQVEINSNFKNFANLCVNRHMITNLNSSNRLKHKILNTSVSLDSKLFGSEYTLLEVLRDKNSSDPELNLIKLEKQQEITIYLKHELTKFELIALNLVLKGLNHTEAGCIMGVTNKGIQNAMYRVRKKIRKFEIK